VAGTIVYGTGFVNSAGAGTVNPVLDFKLF
jgi:hypothetical protein